MVRRMKCFWIHWQGRRSNKRECISFYVSFIGYTFTWPSDYLWKPGITHYTQASHRFSCCCSCFYCPLLTVCSSGVNLAQALVNFYRWCSSSGFFRWLRLHSTMFSLINVISAKTWKCTHSENTCLACLEHLHYSPSFGSSILSWKIFALLSAVEQSAGPAATPYLLTCVRSSQGQLSPGHWSRFYFSTTGQL